MNDFPYILTEDTLTVVFQDETKVLHSNNPNWTDAIEYLKIGDFAGLNDTMDLASAVSKFVGQGLISVHDGNVWFADAPLDNSMTTRILSMMSEGFDIQPMVNFLSNLMDNPSKLSVDNLYRFLEHNSLPITSDGHFLAYKNVSSDYKDHRTGTFDNSVGSVCQMPRNSVEDDPSVTCSHGLHFCSIEYLNGMWGHRGHTMIVKINPADVVSIPTDYNNAKGRACRYEVIAEHMDQEKDTLSEHSVYEYEVKPDFTEVYDCGFNLDGDCELE